MAGLNADHINPFLIAATNILKGMCMVDVKIDKPSIKRADFTNDSIVIMIGITGEIKGQVLISFSDDTACDIASRMMMTKILFMDDLSMSAISELGNMILGNAATIFSTKEIEIDITPPSICKGNVSFSNTFSQNISVPLLYEDKMFEINIAII